MKSLLKKLLKPLLKKILLAVLRVFYVAILTYLQRENSKRLDDLLAGGSALLDQTAIAELKDAMQDVNMFLKQVGHPRYQELLCNEFSQTGHIENVIADAMTKL